MQSIQARPITITRIDTIRMRMATVMAKTSEKGPDFLRGLASRVILRARERSCAI